MERMATKKTQRRTIWEFVLLHRRINLYWREKKAHYFILALRKIKRPKSRKNLCSNKTTALCEKNNLIIMTFLFGQSVNCSIRKCITMFFFLPLYLISIQVTNMIQQITSTCSLLESVLLDVCHATLNN